MRTKRIPLLWKWSLRDLRLRWMQVVGISIIIALGVAIFSGLGSATPWRTRQLDVSYAMLNMYDLKLELTPGSFLEAERLAQVIRSIPHADDIEELDLRLNFATTVDASLRQAQDTATPDRSVLVSGQIIGVDVTEDGPVVSRLHPSAGRVLQASDAGKPVCIVEHNFATFYDLEPGDRPIQVSGGKTLEPVGNGISAEYFMVLEEGSGIFGLLAQERYAVLFVPLETAQEIAGLPDQVNEALITVVEGVDETDLDRLKDELESAMEQALPQVGLEMEKRSENPLFRMLYDDIPGDQQMYDTFAFTLLLGATFGAFILIGRVVDAQRREIGINMALGVSPLRIARRYLLMGAQISFLGMGLGVVLGLLLNRPMGRLVEEMLPTPYFEAPFQPQVFVRGALVGMAIPFLAIIYPVWRAVRVAPVDAIQTGYLVSKGGGLAPLLARLPLGRLPGSSFTLLPLRNLSRGLRRTLMTALGLAMAIIVLVAVIGFIDSFMATLDVGGDEIRQGAPDRTMVSFDDFYALSDPLISDIAASANVAQVVPSILLPGKLAGDETIDVFVQLMDLDNDLWTPTILRGGTVSDEPAILITDKAARDLGLDVGDTVSLLHPYRESRHAWRMAESLVRVAGIHPDVLRMAVYMDIEDAHLMNLAGSANNVYVNPAAGVAAEDLRQELFQVGEVTSVQRASAAFDTIEGFIDDFMGVFAVIQVIVFVMAFLIAFNTTRTNVEERRRELATMFAFGTPVRIVVRMAMVENLILGLLGTALGLALGWLTLNQIMTIRMEVMMPELNYVIAVAPATLGWTVLIGVVAVALTPILVARRLAGMDIPSTLRVME